MDGRAQAFRCLAQYALLALLVPYGAEAARPNLSSCVDPLALHVHKGVMPMPDSG